MDDEYRKKNFKVQLNDKYIGSEYPKGEEKRLSITQNGTHWTSLALTKEEAKKVIIVLFKWCLR